MEDNETYYNRAIYTTLRVGFVALLLVWSFEIVKPFLLVVLWGVIIAVAIYPSFKKLAKILGAREKLSATLITLVALLMLIVPSLLFINSAVDGLGNLSKKMEAGTIKIPPPKENVAEWPIIGKPVYDVWKLTATNLDAAITKFEPQIKAFAPKVFSIASNLGTTVLLFMISIIIAGALLTKAELSEKAAGSVFRTLIGKQGKEFVRLSIAIIRSVVQGVLGVAAIQSLLGGIGIWAVGIPAPGLWALIILFFAIMQLPPLLILGPLAIYAFTFAGTTPAIIFLVWSIIVSASDAFLKPLFLGRGVDVPMLAVLLGAIGGMIMSGIIGLFVGAVVLAITYKVFEALLVKGEVEIKKREDTSELKN